MPSPRAFGKTPESNFSGLLRKDSKHALTTCHGITGNGRACRRPLGGSESPSAARYTIKGAMLMPNNHEDPAVFFCWQHKDQADLLKAQDVEVVEVHERASLETVFRNLGLEEVEEEEEEAASPSLAARPQKSREPRTQSNPTRAIPRTSPKRTVPDSRLRLKEMEGLQPSKLKPSPSDPKPGFLASLFGCVLISESPTAPLPPPQPRNRRRKLEQVVGGGRARVPNKEILIDRTIRASKDSTAPQAKAVAGKSPDYKSSSSPRRDSGARGMGRKKDNLKVYRDPAQSSMLERPNLRLHAHSEPRQPLVNKRPDTERSKSTPERSQVSKEWMPQLPPSSTDTMRLVYAKLLVAMSEAPTKSDTQGYIYMFWQTDEKQTDAETTAAASIVSGSKSRSQRAQEEILQRRFFQTSANAARPALEDRTIFLKIGRAANVHQRMGQWQSQCGYNISLLRYYPHDAAEDSVKVRYVGKVERLVHLHLEMLGKRFNRQCRCGTEHKEWFQVDANPREVRAVDDIIRQWVAWCDGKFGTAVG